MIGKIEHLFYNGINLLTKDVTWMLDYTPQKIRLLLQTAYQKNQLTTITYHGVTKTGTVDFVTASTVYLGLAAGHSREIPLTQISQVKLHQLQSWWYLYDSSAQ